MQIEDVLKSQKVSIKQLSNKEFIKIDRLWLDAFATRVKKETGKWVYRGFRWHGFSYEYEPHISGQKALSKYLTMNATRFYVFDEDGRLCLECTGSKPPDLSGFQGDLYIADHNMHWTLVHTHEEPEIGPFFCERNT